MISIPAFLQKATFWLEGSAHHHVLIRLPKIGESGNSAACRSSNGTYQGCVPRALTQNVFLSAPNQWWVAWQKVSPFLFPLRQTIPSPFGPHPGDNQLSIHVLQIENDAPARQWPGSYRHFYPRSPYGERPIHAADRLYLLYFYPRLSYRGVPLPQPQRSRHIHFYSHSLYEERRYPIAGWSDLSCISPCTPIGRATRLPQQNYPPSHHFHPRPPHGGRQQHAKTNFYSCHSAHAFTKSNRYRSFHQPPKNGPLAI